MIVCFAGTIFEESDLPISGNGKTCSMVGVSYMDHIIKNKTIWSNFKTDFSENVMYLQEMIDIIGDEPHENLILTISEMQKILNSIGAKGKQVLFIEKFVSQIRKQRIDLYYDTQRFRNIHLRLRTFTDVIYIPQKKHFDNSICLNNLCKAPHKIELYAYKPSRMKPVATFNAAKVGQHYDTNEVIYDTLNLITKSEEDD